jgi:hypothetical protein
MWGALSDERTGLPFTTAQLLLALVRAVILGSESRGTRDHICVPFITLRHIPHAKQSILLTRHVYRAVA